MSDTDKLKIIKEVRTMARNALLETDNQAELERSVIAVEKAQEKIQELLDDSAAHEAELAAAVQKTEELTNKVQGLETKARELEEALAEARRAVEEQRVRAEKAESDLSAIEQDRKLQDRVHQLEAAKILKSGDKLEAQRAKVKVMSDEEFASYKDELVDLRTELEAALREAASTTSTVADVADDTVDVLPPEVKKEAANVVIPNPELVNEDQLRAKMQKFANALLGLTSNNK